MNKRLILFGIAALLLLSAPLSAQEDMYASRRHELMQTIGEGFVVLFADAPQGSFDKSFYYLTGMKENGAVLALIPGRDVEEIIFNRTGEWSYTADNPAAVAHPIDALSRQLPRYVMGKDTAFVSFRDLGSLAANGRFLSRVSVVRNVDVSISRIRAVKDDNELEFLRQACLVTAEGLNDVFRAVEAGMQEEDLAVLLEFGFKLRDSRGYSFLQAASGPNATNIHFGAGERVIEDGDVIVFDVGAYWEDYTSDISRTIPVSGTFTQEQREIYTVVLNSQKAAIERMVPGALLSDVRQAAQDVLINGLHDLGLVLDTDNEAQRQFFIVHGYYHFIGLDVHDVWSDYLLSPGEMTYEPGMVMTMEPGLYFPEDRLDRALARLGSGEEDAEMRTFLEAIRPVYQRYVNIGVRIEDDVLITADGNEILTAVVPKEIDEIEAMMRQANPFAGLPSGVTR